MNRLLSRLLPWALLALGLSSTPVSLPEISRNAPEQVRSAHPGAQHALAPSFIELQPLPATPHVPILFFGEVPPNVFRLPVDGAARAELPAPIPASDFVLRKAHRARSPPASSVG